MKHSPTESLRAYERYDAARPKSVDINTTGIPSHWVPIKLDVTCASDPEPRYIDSWGPPDAEYGDPWWDEPEPRQWQMFMLYVLAGFALGISSYVAYLVLAT